MVIVKQAAFNQSGQILSKLGIVKKYLIKYLGLCSTAALCNLQNLADYVGSASIYPMRFVQYTI